MIRMKLHAALLLLVPTVFAGTRNIGGISVTDEVFNEWAAQYDRIEMQIASSAERGALHKAGATPEQPYLLDANAMIWESDKDPLDVVVRRAAALLNDFKTRPGVNKSMLAGFEKRLNALKSRAANIGLGKAVAQQRTGMYYEAAALRRQLALSNPLLNDINELIFTVQGNKYHNSTEFIRHIIQCDDYGFTATPCGGIYVVSNFKTGTPQVRDLLADATVKSGRYQGQKLSGRGAFNSLDVSYDGNELVFAWVESPKNLDGICLGLIENFTLQTCFHIFRLNIATNEIWQITDGPDNDYNPCWTPDGRIVFSSERRKSIVRCDAPAECSPVIKGNQPCGTLFSMKPDGTDLYPISWHETTEIQPSIDNNGMLVYTRWDYIDRCFHIAHNLWTSTPDGCDPRAPHGNYPYPHSMVQGTGTWPTGDLDGRASRPWAEYGIRAVPQPSNKYIAVSGWHHGPHGGEPILIDLAVRDDNMMSQVKTFRAGCCLPHESYVIAPGIGNPPKVCPTGCSTDYFSNNVCKFMYSPWPLSEEYFLAGIGGGMQGGSPVVSPAQLVLVDKFGTEELVVQPEVKWYGQAGISDEPKVMYVMPLKSRTKPPVIVRRTYQGERANTSGHFRATIAVQNVNTADFQWPANTKIKKLRVIQLLSRPQGAGDHTVPPMGYGEGSQGRMVLGTAPVDDDGSAYFEAPVGKEIMFQALDEKGMAVQSMRSATYVHPGEQLMCTGCHEDKWTTPDVSKKPTAWMGPPDELQPDVGTGWPNDACPITFARLMGTTINSKCQPCHNSKGANVDLSYTGLKDRAFFFNGFEGFNSPMQGGSRTIAGHFGARESGLGKTLMGAHTSENRITQEEFHRVTTWLDCNSMELAAYGGYNFSGGGGFRSTDDVTSRQRNGEIVWPEIDVDPNDLTAVEKSRPVNTTAVALQQWYRHGGSPQQNDGSQGPQIIIVRGAIVDILNQNRQLLSIRILDCSGRVVHSVPERTRSPLVNVNFQRLNISPGMYMLRVVGPEITMSKMVSKIL